MECQVRPPQQAEIQQRLNSVSRCSRGVGIRTRSGKVACPQLVACRNAPLSDVSRLAAGSALLKFLAWVGNNGRHIYVGGKP